MPLPTEIEPARVQQMQRVAQRHMHVALALITLAISLPTTLLSSCFLMTLAGAGGIFVGGMVVGYQAALIGRDVASVTGRGEGG